MLIPKPKFHQLAQDAVDQLAREGIVCAPDEILWLHQMAEGIVKFAFNDPSRFLDFPTPCGNVLLWPLSIGAKQWFKSVASWFEFSASGGSAWGGDNRLYTLVQAYVMAHGRNPESLLAINTRLEAVWKILRWSMRINCSLAELSRAMDEVNAREEWVDIKTPKEEKNEKAGAPLRPKSDWGEILARLEHFYPGHSLAYWLWELSDEAVAVLLDRSNNFLPLEQQVSRKDKNFHEFSEFRLVVKYIRDSRKLAAQSVESGGKMNGDNRPDHIDGRKPDEGRSSQENNPDKKPSGHDLAGPGKQ